MQTMEMELSEIANSALGTISEPVYTYAEVRNAFNNARDQNRRRLTFKTFLSKTGLDEKIFLRGSSGGTRVMYKSDVHEAFEYLVELYKSEMPQAPYKRKVSSLKRVKGLMLGYCKLYATKKGGTGDDRNQLKHPLSSVQNWKSISQGLKRDGRSEDLEYLVAAMEKAGLSIPTASNVN
jgi:hypothetical protein